MPRSFFLAAACVVFAFPARVEAGQPLCLPGAGPAACVEPAQFKPGRSLPEAAPCPADWFEARRGGCWIKTGVFGGGGDARAFVHPRGWVVDARCLEDARFSRAELLGALESAWRKMSPGVPVAQGGCLGDFNPEWGRELVASVWSKRMHLACGAFDPEAPVCASHESRDRWERDAAGNFRRAPDELHVLSLRNVARCMGEQGSGLAGVLFHETLHGAGADNFSSEKHNLAWQQPQFEWIRDRVYGTEAVCFFAVDPAKRRFVNVFQCHSAVRYRAESPREGLCAGFGASFTDLQPQGFLKH